MTDGYLHRQFETWDWVLFAALLVISSAIGVFYALRELVSKKTTTGEFMMGSRQMQILPVGISILVSFMSAILILGFPAEMYTAGTLFYISLLSIIIGIILATIIFVPLLYPLKLTSTFEYLELRFHSKAAKLTGTAIMVVQQILYMGIASYAPSTALEAVTGFPTWATIITVGCVSTFYTFLGGMKAVVWTDVFQSLVMIAGLLAIVIQGTIKVGNMSKVWDINEQWGRIDFWEADANPTTRHSVWSLVIGGSIGWLGTYGVNQASVQRYCALPTLNKSRGAVLINTLGVIILITVTSLCGIVMFAYYAQKGCDPLQSKMVANSNQLIPYFVMEILGYPGLPGLFISCLFSGALSTMSSCLNALSAVTWEDCLKPLLAERVSERAKTWIIKLLVIVYGAAGVGFAFMAQNLGGTVLQASLSFTGAASGPLLGIFLLGGLFPWANWIGCVMGGVLGLAFPLWISIGAYNLPSAGYSLDFPTANCSRVISNTTTSMPAPAHEPSGVELLYTVSYLWYPSIGMATSVVVGLLTSLVTGPMKVGEVDPKYLIPIFDRLFCCLPASWRRVLRCQQEFKNPKDIVPDGYEEDDVEMTVAAGEVKNGNSVNVKDPQIFGVSTYRPSKNGVTVLSYRSSLGHEFVYENPAFNSEKLPPPPYDM